VDTIYGHWNVDKVGDFSSADYHGFVYRVDFNDGAYYIGCRRFRTKLPKRKKDGRKRRWDEEAWKSYTTSSDAVNARILTGDIPTFTILDLAGGQSVLRYLEQRRQFENSVLIDIRCLNKVIGAREHFPALVKQLQASRLHDAHKFQRV
jgi:hypothetical protein